jgi:dTDP-4-amino-4,6-dideoxygalactose transaminase
MKYAVDELALFGGERLFEAPLHVGRPNLGNREVFLQRVNDILDRNYLTNGGPYEVAFEQRVAELAGVRHCIAMCNATVALEIAIRAAGLTGEVIVPSFTFVATAHALQWQEITPVFCDIDPVTCTIDPRRVEELITPRTTGIIGVHVWGRACDIDALSEIAERRGLKLLFDAAHAVGCTYRGRPLGSFGAAEVFSFHATKFINSFEGGAIVTNDDELAHRARLMKNFGFVGYDRVAYVGTNGKMSEVSAAMGLTSLDSILDFIAVNRANYQLYAKGLMDIPGVTVVPYDETERSNFQYVVLQVDAAVSGVTRDRLLRLLHAENVLARRYFYPGCHRMEPYRSYFPNARLLLPITEQVSERVLSLPTGTAVGPTEIASICQLIRFVVERGAEITPRVPEEITEPGYRSGATLGTAPVTASPPALAS